MSKKNKKQKYGYCAGALLAVLFMTNPVFAAESEESDAKALQYTMEQVVVTATRTEKPIIDVPANTKVVTAEEIKKGGYSSVFEAVKNLTHTNAQSYQEDGGDYTTGGMSSRIRIRGVDAGTLILINGNPSNFMNYGTLNSIPIDQVERIEIVKGAGSVLYGPQALGGVVNVITKKPGETDKTTGNVYTTVGNRIREAGVNVQTDSFNFGMKKSFTDDLNDIQHAGSTGAGQVLNIKDKKADQMYFDIKLSDELTFSYGRTHNEAKFETGTFKNYTPNLQYLADIESTFNNYALLYDAKDKGLKIVAGYNTLDSSSTYDKSYPKQYSDNTSSGYNANLDVQKKINLRSNKDSLIVGANFTRENMSYHSGATTNAKNERDSYALYQSYDYQLTDKFNLIAGLREYHVSSSKYQDSDFQLLPQLQGLYKVNNQSSYYFNIGKAFEMPGINSGFSYNSNYVVNPDLKPQTSWSYEVGYKFEDEFRAFSADVFYMTVKDKFYWDKTSSGASIMKNRDKWENTGLELDYTQKLSPEWTANLGLTIQDPKAYSKTTSKWVQDACKYILNVGANYNKDKFTADARLFAYLDREPAYYTYARTSASNNPDHNLANSCDVTLTLNYRPTQTETIRLVGRNLLDRNDVINSYEYYCTPVNFSLTYERKF